MEIDRRRRHPLEIVEERVRRLRRRAFVWGFILALVCGGAVISFFAVLKAIP